MNINHKWAVPVGIFILIPIIWYSTSSPSMIIPTFQTLADKRIIHTTELKIHSKQLPQKDTTNSTASPFESFSKNPPSYLKNTEIRGQLAIMEDGSLLITDDIRKRFDYFYMMIGDRSLAEINAIIVDHLRLELSEPAQSQALQLLQQYINYLNEYDTFSQGLDILAMQDDPQWAANEINNMRTFHLGEETSHIFFGQQEMLKNSHLQPANHSLSAHLLANQEKTLQLTTLQKRTSTLKANNADNQSIQRMRIELVGEEAANRLALLDISRQKWQKKQQDFQVLKVQWGNATGLDENDKRLAFEKQAMQDLSLTPNELKRLKAISRYN